jgi:hypothetical protein
LEIRVINLSLISLISLISLAGGIVAYAVVPIGVAIVFSVGTGIMLDALDKQHELTEKLSKTLEDISEKIVTSTKNAIHDSQRSAYQGLGGFIRGQTGYKGPF